MRYARLPSHVPSRYSPSHLGADNVLQWREGTLFVHSSKREPPQLVLAVLFVEDNAAAKAIAEQSNFKGKNKHFELRWSFICELIERGIIRIEKIPRRLRLADLGTGARPHPDFLRLSRSIYGEDSSQDVQP